MGLLDDTTQSGGLLGGAYNVLSGLLGGPSILDQMRAIGAARANTGAPLQDFRTDMSNPAFRSALSDLAGNFNMVGNIKAYHGSPHSFSQFDAGRAGSTNGIGPDEAQGLYFTNSPRLASAYRGQNGRVYEVNLRPDPEDLLDWEKPLTAQSPKVKAALEALGVKGGESGETIYKSIGADRLRQLGIPGTIQGQGRNQVYVMFDGSQVEMAR